MMVFKKRITKYVCVWIKVFDDCNCNRNELLQLRKRRDSSRKNLKQKMKIHARIHTTRRRRRQLATCERAMPIADANEGDCELRWALASCLLLQLLALGSCSAQQLCLRSVLPVDCLNMYSSDEYVMFALSCLCMYAWVNIAKGLVVCGQETIIVSLRASSHNCTDSSRVFSYDFTSLWTILLRSSVDKALYQYSKLTRIIIIIKQSYNSLCEKVDTVPVDAPVFKRIYTCFERLGDCWKSSTLQNPKYMSLEHFCRFTPALIYSGKLT